MFGIINANFFYYPKTKNKTTMNNKTTWALLLMPFTAAGFFPAFSQTTTDDELPILETFIAEQSAAAITGDLNPTSREVFSVFGNQSIIDVPRSVTVITPEMMQAFDIQSFRDISRIGAGTQQANFYGVPGVPSFRGAKGSVFFNGMQRAYQRNEMPLSFGSLEGMDLVKGPAPAHMGAALVGGYANLIPKMPYFDKQRGSVMVEIGQYDHYRIQADVGGPTLIGGIPSASRISLTAQQADSYYNDVSNDYVSLYASIKAQLRPNVMLFTGTEYFNYKSNENAGWNRLTQNLVSNNQYVIGEPISVSDSRWGGRANRRLHTLQPALVVPEAAVINRFGSAAAAVAAGLLDMSDPATRDTVYGVFGAERPFLAETDSGFLYTQDFFDNGGEVFTTPIKGSTVLSDPTDFANSENIFWFADLDFTANADRKAKFQFILDYIRTTKRSSYSYAIDTQQFVTESKLTVSEDLDFLKSNVTYGGSFRFSRAKTLQDFWDEPFSRRDISQSNISGNSQVFAGGMDPEGTIRWNSPFQATPFAPSLGAYSIQSDLFQYSLFGYSITEITDSITLYSSLLGAYANYKASTPSQAFASGLNPVNETSRSGDKLYYSASVSPVLALTDNINLYAMLQYGTAIEPLQGGAIIGEGQFSTNRLYEFGTKGAFLDGRLYAGLASFLWQQSASLSNAGGDSVIQQEGKGVEFEITYAVTDNFTLIGSANYQIVELKNPIGFRVVPTDEQGFALFGGELQTPFSQNQGGFDPSFLGAPANNPNLRLGGTPETQLKLFGVYELENGFGGSLGAIWSDSYWASYDRNVKLPSTLVFDGSIFYRTPRYEIRLTVENLTNEDWFYGADPFFAASGIITKAPERTFKATFTYNF
jgi:iron complex outermembrane recepter protein